MNAEVDVFVLPEMWNNGYDLEHLSKKQIVLKMKNKQWFEKI